MYLPILSANQSELLSFIKQFNSAYYLAGGTAIALQLGHRQSEDFDLFSYRPLNKEKINRILKTWPFNVELLYQDPDQQDVMINNVKCTFLYYPYLIAHEVKLENFLTMPSLIDLGAMKVLSMARRSKWKDFVDLYFLLKEHFSIPELIGRAEKYFPGQVTEKLFRSQLAYHGDIDFTEAVNFLIPNPPSQKEIKEFLTEVSTNF